MQIIRCDTSHDTMWNEFVHASPRASFYHRAEWRGVNQQCFGHETVYLAALDDSRIVGVMPQVRLKSLLFGNVACSMPFVNYGGPCGESDEIEQSLLEAAAGVADEWKVDFLEIRSRRHLGDRYPCSEHKVSMVIALDPDPEVVMGRFKREHRAEIRRAYKNGFTARFGPELIDDFYAVLSESWRDMGTPIYSIDYLKAVLAAFPGRTRVCVIYDAAGTAVAGAFDGIHAGTVEGMWLGMRSDYRRQLVGYVLYWELIKHACEAGYRSFHLGRSSKDSGAEQFKKKWNAEMTQLYWQYILRTRKEIPSLNPTNPKFQLAIKAWQKLPVPMTQIVGPVHRAEHPVVVRQDSSVLDTLRTTAIVLVVICHLFETLAPLHPYDWYLGRLGVLLFFVHTSCVLMMSLQRTALTGAPLAIHFYVRRAFRIYPLSALTVALVVAFHVPPMAWITTPPDSSVRSVAANLLLVQDLVGVDSVSAPLWSLPLELQMYLFLPGIFALIKRGDSLERAMALWGVGLLVGLADALLGLRLAIFIPCFLSGVVGYCVARRVRPRLPFWLWPVTLLGLTAGYIGLAQSSGEVHPPAVGWVTCLATGVLLPQFEEASSVARAVPAWIAKYSYGIYLSHMVTLFIGFRLLGEQPWLVQWAAFLGLTTGISILAFHVVEAPLIRAGGRVAGRLKAGHTPSPVSGPPRPANQLRTEPERR